MPAAGWELADCIHVFLNDRKENNLEFIFRPA